MRNIFLATSLIALQMNTASAQTKKYNLLGVFAFGGNTSTISSEFDDVKACTTASEEMKRQINAKFGDGPFFTLICAPKVSP